MAARYWKQTSSQSSKAKVRIHFAECFGDQKIIDQDTETALQARPLCRPIPTGRENGRFRATKWIIDTSKLQTGWIDTPSGHVPVWLQYGDQPLVPKNVLYLKAEAMDAFDASIWICVDEIREMFGLQDDEGGKGEWLACGFIPSNMVIAQVILSDYQKRPDLAYGEPETSKGLRRSDSVGSIRSISAEEQKEHMRVQILRNKASREGLQRTRAAIGPSRGKERPLLRQAINNIKVSIPRNNSIHYSNTVQRSASNAEKEVPRRPRDTRAAYLDQEDTLPLLTNANVAEGLIDHSHYASIRSPVLREALERRKPTVPVSQVLETKSALLPDSQKATENHKYSGLEERLRELSLKGDGGNDSDSRKSGAESLAQETDDLHLLTHSERLRRARAGKRRTDFYALGQNPGLTLGTMTDAESNSSRCSESLLGCALDIVSTVLDELERRRARSAAPGPPPSDECGSSLQYTPCSVDGQTSSGEEASGYEADISDNFSSASERIPLRRTRRRSAHSRLTTPLGLYKYGHTPTRG